MVRSSSWSSFLTEARRASEHRLLLLDPDLGLLTTNYFDFISVHSRSYKPMAGPSSLMNSQRSNASRGG
jgi:hypothetical protein